MHYFDYQKEDQELMDQMLEYLNDRYPGWTEPQDLQDDEFFFRTEEEVKNVMEKWLDSSGSYGSMARELFAYFDDCELEDEYMQIHELGWGFVAKVGDGRHLFYSSSWSDSGLLINAS